MIMTLAQLPPPNTNGSRVIIEKTEPQTQTEVIEQKVDHTLWYGLAAALLLVVAILAATSLVKKSK